MVKKNSVDGPFVCSWCGLEDWNLQKILDHENTEHVPNQKSHSDKVFSLNFKFFSSFFE